MMSELSADAEGGLHRTVTVFKKYSQMKPQMKREALTKINRQANESGPSFGTVQPN